MNKASLWILIGLMILILGQISCSDKDPTPGEKGVGPDGSELPYFVINTLGNVILDEPKVNASMAVFVNRSLTFSNPIGIEYRGSTSRRLFEKKSYGIEFWDENGADISLPLFDFGSEEDWILNGPYSDKTFFRNVLIFDLSNAIGRYAPKTMFAELELNGSYDGLYVFMEKIKRDGDRLPLPPLDPTIVAGDEITGGYILKIDKTAGDSDISDWDGDALYTEGICFRSDYDTDGNPLEYPAFGSKQSDETYFLYEYPDEDDINEEQKNYIQQYIRDFEKALLADDFSTDIRNYQAYIDVGSFVDYFILNELSGNPDAYRLSTFLHKDRGGKLAMGPIWDFNIALGNDGRSTPYDWIYMYNDYYPGDLWLIHFWWERLMSDPTFRSAIKTRWESLRNGLLSNASILSRIDQWVVYLDANGAIDRNYERWPVIGEPLPFNVFVGGSYQEEIDYLNGWIEERLAWMDGEIASW